MSRLIAFMLLFALTVNPVRALDCKTAITQADMNECAGQGFKAADDALNQAYAALSKRVARAGAADAKALLIGAQHDWLAFRDAECAFQASGVEGGSAQPMVILGCREDLTRKRTVELNAYLSCQEGDLSCPGPGQESEVAAERGPAPVGNEIGRRTPIM